MNQAPPGLSQPYGGAPFGGSMFPTPIWYPPVGTKWIITLFIVFAGAVANRLKSDIRKMIVSPPGFLLISLLALYVLDFPPLSFAILFFLLSVWVAEQSTATEGFLSGLPIVDFVGNNKRWFVESVLKERPMGIQEKDVQTYPSGST